MHLVQQRRIRMFHETWAPGHNSTDYERYYTANPGEMYKVTQFQSSYEPYTIFRKDGPPWCAQPPSLLVCMTLTLCRDPKQVRRAIHWIWRKQSRVSVRDVSLGNFVLCSFRSFHNSSESSIRRECEEERGRSLLIFGYACRLTST